MTANDFEQMSMEERRTTVAREGAYLTYRQVEEGTLMLFQVQSFYVELLLHQDGVGGPHLTAFDSWEQLDPYLGTIQLESLGILGSN